MTVTTFTFEETIRHFEAMLSVLTAHTFAEWELCHFRDLRNIYMDRIHDDLVRNPRNMNQLLALFSDLNRAKDRVDAILYPEG